MKGSGARVRGVRRDWNGPRAGWRSWASRGESEERVRSFVEEQPAYIVYADPRAEGEITFHFFQKTLSGNLSKARGASRSFFIKDIWKNDLPGKYRARVAKALG